MWRVFFRPDISVSAPFVWRCLSGSTVAPFPHEPDAQISRHETDIVLDGA